MSKHNDDEQERGRVYSRIAPIIVEFSRKYAGQKFHMEQLRRYVTEQDPGVAPDSPGRILRELRLMNRLDYVVLDRRASLYQFRHRIKPPLTSGVRHAR